MADALGRQVLGAAGVVGAAVTGAGNIVKAVGVAGGGWSKGYSKSGGEAGAAGGVDCCNIEVGERQERREQ